MFTRTLTTGLVTFGVFAAASLAGVQTTRNHVLTPDGFCQGVRYDGQTYEQWLADHAFADEVAYRTQVWRRL